MKRIISLLLLGSVFSGCNQQTAVLPDDLTGVWVEVSARKDTLIFNLDQKGKSLPQTLIVQRGREINTGGYLVPKIGSGLYKYEILNSRGRIDVVNLLSSFGGSTDYAFQQKGNQIEVENFFELGFNKPATATRTLVRL